MAKVESGFFLQQAELFLKVGTASVAILYVLGLMISNAQLMELGIADFASLQARNVMVGFLFFIYLLVLAIIVAPVALIIPLFVRKANTSSRSVWSYMAAILALIVVEAALLLAAGSFVGYLYPGGRTWMSYLNTSPLAIYEDFRAQLHQLYDTYFRAKIVLVCTGMFIIETVIFLYFFSKDRYLKDIIVNVRTNPIIMILMVFSVVTYPSFALFDYADEVYPNLRFNLGGGQPQISDLTLAGKKAELHGLNQTGLLVSSTCCGVGDEESVKIPQAAIWYQSDKFLYVAQAANQMKSRVVGIDLKLIRSIHYLPEYVRVVSGGRIENIRPIRP